MFTFITIVSTSHEKFFGRDKIEVRTPFSISKMEKVVTKIETRAWTAEQAEKQAIAKSDLTVRDGFGSVIEDAELTINTIRKFAIEVERK